MYEPLSTSEMQTCKALRHNSSCTTAKARLAELQSEQYIAYLSDSSIQRSCNIKLKHKHKKKKKNHPKQVEPSDSVHSIRSRLNHHLVNRNKHEPDLLAADDSRAELVRMAQPSPSFTSSSTINIDSSSSSSLNVSPSFESSLPGESEELSSIQALNKMKEYAFQRLQDNLNQTSKTELNPKRKRQRKQRTNLRKEPSMHQPQPLRTDSTMKTSNKQIKRNIQHFNEANKKR